ncbi:Glucose-methanol-choline oxidoreductase [Lasiodiplodia theobromae]|uniref:Glucose-methanol-choline oxidoreductase n=1 Tax=Lasiodiplodia theobromae TaxID=45133 RepID=UPI0015C30E4D|nr:Glucose-methanol-choline oxidoreductase [Lasiodiplodia theobromae]KAF4535602.1 Glucose-methanol-choline oxidoreductase [Lasiodiplodia theobromae]
MATWSNEAIITLIALILLVVQMVTHAIHFFYNHRQRTRSFDVFETHDRFLIYFAWDGQGRWVLNVEERSMSP